MVRGLNIFKQYFGHFPENYVIIGGTACDIIIEKAALKPRATKDIDIVLIVEALNREFVIQFWQFIKDGNYERNEKSADERKYYRFTKPENDEFPHTIELFSRNPNIIEFNEPAHLTPIPVDDDLSSLSAILLDEEYYNFLINHSSLNDGIHIANLETLICLKAKAYLDMIERKKKDNKIDSKNIKKHKNDIFRLAVMLTGNNNFTLSENIGRDMKLFSDNISEDIPKNNVFIDMGLGNIDSKNILNQIVSSFNLDSIVIIEHEVNLLRQKQKPPKIRIKKSLELIDRILQNVYFPFLTNANTELSKFNTLFNDMDWYYFEEPQAPKFNIPLIPVSTDFKNMLQYFKQVTKNDGDGSFHQYKAMYWLMNYNDKKDFSIEVAFKIWFLDYHYNIEVFIGQPFESSSMFQGFKKIIQSLTRDYFSDNNPFDTFVKYKLPKKEYDELVSDEDISKWSKELSNNLLEIIKKKTEK